MSLSAQDWDRRFLLQAQWTGNLRRYLYDKVALRNAARVLEVGCGTGAVTTDIQASTSALVLGLDIRLDFLQVASAKPSQSSWLQADGLCLPFASSTFDFVCCHFLLLWVPAAERICEEMARVTRPGGWMAALAEPDYGGRIDYPPQFEQLGALQAQKLTKQGADPCIGRRLGALFHSSGLVNVEMGIIGAQWNAPPKQDEWLSEWSMLKSDLHGSIEPLELARLQNLDFEAWQQGRRILFIPTFYACGRAPLT